MIMQALYPVKLNEKYEGKTVIALIDIRDKETYKNIKYFVTNDLETIKANNCSVYHVENNGEIVNAISYNFNANLEELKTALERLHYNSIVDVETIDGLDNVVTVYLDRYGNRRSSELGPGERYKYPIVESQSVRLDGKLIDTNTDVYTHNVPRALKVGDIALSKERKLLAVGMGGWFVDLGTGALQHEPAVTYHDIIEPDSVNGVNLTSEEFANIGLALRHGVRGLQEAEASRKKIDEIVERAHKEADEREWCSEFDDILEALDLPTRSREYLVTVSRYVNARDEEDARENFDYDYYDMEVSETF